MQKYLLMTYYSRRKELSTNIYNTKLKENGRSCKKVTGIRVEVRGASGLGIETESSRWGIGQSESTQEISKKKKENWKQLLS